MNDMYESSFNSTAPAANPYGVPLAGTAGGYDSLFQILWRGRWLALLSLLLAAAGAYAYLRFATPMYESTARLLVDKPSSQSRSDVPQPAGSTLNNYVATQAGMITSPEIVAVALRDPNVTALPGLHDPNYAQDLIDTLTAEVAKKADIIQITASAPYPEDAAQFVNAVVRAYTRWHEANRQLTTADLLKDLNAQLDHRYRELQQKRAEQVRFEQSHPEVQESAPGGMISKALEVLRDQRAAAGLNVVDQNSYYEGLHRLEAEPEAFRQYVYSHQATPATAVTTAAVANDEHDERVRLQLELESARLQLEEIRTVGTAQHARIAMLENRQRDLQAKIAAYDTRFVRQQVLLAKTRLEDARAQEQKIAEMYDKEFAKVQSLSDLQAQYAFLKSECATMESLYNALVGQINQLDLGARLEGLKVYILERAVLAEKPASPQPARVGGIALVLGLLGGTGLSLLRNARDQRVRSSEEITATLGLPILGAVPSASRRVIARKQRLRFAENSPESEACRAIRTALLCGVQRDQMQTILVTSPGPREGKTLLVSNLGMAMAQAGQRTLIVDADLRKPLAQRVFTTGRLRPGLVEVLEGTVAFREAIRSTERAGLDVLEGGRSTSNPSELLNSPAFAALLERLRQEYDRILMDSPPVGVVTDAQILASLSDSTLLVLRAEESSRLLLQRARDALLAVNAPVAGVIVNDVSRRDGRYGYYHAYGEYHLSVGVGSHPATYRKTPPDAGPCAEGVAPVPAGESRTPVESGPEGDAPMIAGQTNAGAGVVESTPTVVDSHPATTSLPVPIRESDDQAAPTDPSADLRRARGREAPIPVAESATPVEAGPESVTPVIEGETDSGAGTVELSRMDADSGPPAANLPVPILEIEDNQATRSREATDLDEGSGREAPVQAGEALTPVKAGPESVAPAMEGNTDPGVGVVEVSRTDADSGPPAAILPVPIIEIETETKEGPCRRTDAQGDPMGTEGTGSGSAGPRKRGKDGPARRPQPAAAAKLPRKRRKRRAATAKRLVTNAVGHAPKAGGDSPKEDEVHGKGLLAEAYPSSEAAALAAERWRRWLQGQ
jgi:succinoglycan biosynthesis transport protein ExoP